MLLQPPADRWQDFLCSNNSRNSTGVLAVPHRTVPQQRGMSPLLREAEKLGMLSSAPYFQEARLAIS
jgi:hypothetical protein